MNKKSQPNQTVFAGCEGCWWTDVGTPQQVFQSQLEDKEAKSGQTDYPEKPHLPLPSMPRGFPGLAATYVIFKLSTLII